jgi:uncharacterized protein (DUF2267 family)
MNYDQFVGQVQARAGLASQGDAVRCIRATLETLGERLDADFADNIAAQLPDEIGRHLQYATGFERMSIDDFYDRVHERECQGSKIVDRPEAVYHIRVVLDVLQEAVSPGSRDKLRTQLPPEFQPLLAGSKGDMRQKG